MYKLHTHKPLECGFIILCPDHNINLLQSTAKSIQARYNIPYICVVDDSAKDTKELKAVCPTFKGRKTFSSLINTGFKHAPAEWNIIVMAGTKIRANLDQKFSLFVENNKDILFPLANNKMNFVDGTLNGLFINKKTFKEIGDMPEEESLELVKAMWGYMAAAKGCKFKAIIGSKMC